jgi:hypothetical protein
MSDFELYTPSCFLIQLTEAGTSDKRFSKIRGLYKYEPLAQLVEHLTFNQRVEGSSPSWLTI